MHKLDKNGFTILELLIATVVFSAVFLGATTGLLQVSKLYFKGVVTTRTQETVRSLTDSLSQKLQFSEEPLVHKVDASFTVNGAPRNIMTFSAYCIGNTRYSYRINAQVAKDGSATGYDQSTNRLAHALWQDTILASYASTCPPADLSKTNPSGAGGTGGQELLAPNMRLSEFLVACNTDTRICSLSVAVIYGDNDILATDAGGDIPTHCASIIGSQWCATSKLSTTVLKRVGATN
ncbi:MAG: prepilin-type N-terminal cleavage/methylation domain-containing protein [Candidatus Saccharibacteria bacterium]